jgi:hypothetical protein
MKMDTDYGRSAEADGLSQAEPEVSALRASIPSAFTIAELAGALANFPSNGKPPMDDLHWELVLLGFVTEHEVKKPCRNCGTALTDYRYFKPTVGGRVFLGCC